MLGVNVGKLFNPTKQGGGGGSTPQVFGSLNFNGINQIATVAHNNLWSLAAGTIEVWVQTSFSAAYQHIFYNGVSIDFGISQDFGGGAQAFADIEAVANPGLFSPGNPSAMTDGLWHHLAVAWDATDIRTFYDGTLKTTNASVSTQSVTGNPLTVGQNAGNGHEWMNGNLTEIRFSNVKRYTNSFTRPTAAFTSDANTLMLLHCTAISAGKVLDVSTSANHLILDATNPPTLSTQKPF